MLNAFAKPFVKLVERWMPDPFIFAVFLTILTFILAVAIAGASPIKAVEEWGKGFWNLLTFAMQITLTLLTGYALAHTPLARGAFTAFAHLAKTPGAAYALTCFAAWVGSLFSWAIV